MNLTITCLIITRMFQLSSKSSSVPQVHRMIQYASGITLRSVFYSSTDKISPANALTIGARSPTPRSKIKRITFNQMHYQANIHCKRNMLSVSKI